ncbi:CvpA family protein [Lujinxingia vulgaris]|uniref:CvpA family protein n=1 Tax=Lujinxingia vulgaris TaxID=2600176 RepID=A0A5C6XFN1_9DELT|nr:CvpA family protein [Lujinxingia vulgaris]TXD38609.1 CvpA family protein [Lujinxingia vulgaris]
MTLDLIAGFVWVVFVALGWRSGALRQIVRIIAAIAVVVASSWVSPLVRDAVFDESGPATPGVEALSLLMAAVGIYVGVVFAGWVAVKILRATSETLGKLDRVAGAGLGGIKGLILVYFAVVLVVLIETPLSRHDPDNTLGLREGRATAFVRSFNVLAPWQFPDLRRLHDALMCGALAAEGGAQDVVRAQGRAADFLRRDAVATMLADDDLMSAVREDHYPLTLADARVRELLNDRDAVDALCSVQWEALREDLERKTLPDAT